MNEWNANNVIYPADKHTLMMIRKFPHYHRFSHTQKTQYSPRSTICNIGTIQTHNTAHILHI